MEYRLDQDRVVCPKRYSTGESPILSNLPLFSELCALCAFARGLVYPILSLSRQDRQERKENFFDPLPWRPLRLCENHPLSDLLLIAPSLS